MDPLVSLFTSMEEEEDEDMPDSLPPEVEEGNIEYKLKLVNPSESRFEHLVTQMKWRLQEGQGEAIYEIGVADSGLLAGLTNDELQASLDTLGQMAARLGADISILREKHLEPNSEGISKRVAEVLVRKVPENQQFLDLRLAVLGNVDAGKSTLLGVLTQGELDNGRGRARLNLFRHLHEIQSGRTSSISHEILGFNSKGEVINYSESRTTEEICENSTKLITLIDLCGHHKYLKTTIFGLTGYYPDFAMLVVSANKGIVGTTKEHLGFALALGVPIFVVISKIDMCRSVQVERTIKQLEKILKSPGCSKVPFRVESDDDAVIAASNFHNDRRVFSGCSSIGTSTKGIVSKESEDKRGGKSLLMFGTKFGRSWEMGNSSRVPDIVLAFRDDSSCVCPIFMCSSVTGKNLNLLTKFLNVLPPLHNSKERESYIQQHSEHQIDVVYSIPSVGVVAGGTILRGTIKEDDRLLVGPTDEGQFHPVDIHSIHRNRMAVRVVSAGQAASIALGQWDKCPIRKGMVLVNPEVNPHACIEFEADIYLLFHQSYICKGFQTVIHVGNVCQTAKIIQMSKGCVKTNEKAVVVFRFINRPEYIRAGSRLIFREGRTKGMGEVTRTFPYEVPNR